MIIHKEGRVVILTALIILMVIYVVVAGVSGCDSIYTTITGIAAIILLVSTSLFFRNPPRKVKADINLVFAPADGKIVDIEEIYESEFIHCKCIKVSIFMSIYNIHVNRYPISGEIKYTRYHPGKYLVARHPKSSELNEHQSTAIQKPDGTIVLVKQIAGTVARRLICYAKVGNEAKQGDDIGFIRFGSRVDLFLPLNTEICVTMNEQVKGNKTIMARFQH
jgi:phosphatidylserine decarboxylase